MQISFVELRRKPGRILEALDRNESITITRRGRNIARIVPARQEFTVQEMLDHPSFGAWKNDQATERSAEYVRKIRRGRFE